MKMNVLYFFIYLFISQKIIYSHIKCKCGFSLANSEDIFNKESDVSLSSFRRTIETKHNVLMHKFKNPHGIFFELFTIGKADLMCENKIFDQSSFFKGYGWSSCVCPICGTHHGWKFFPLKKYCDLDIEEDYKCKRRNIFIGIVTKELELGQVETDNYEGRIEF